MQIFSTDSFKRGEGASLRLDSDSIIFFENELTAYDGKDFETIKASLSSFNLFNQKDIGDKVATIYKYNMIEGTGRSKYAAVKGGLVKDAPMMSVAGNQYAMDFADVYCGIQFSKADIMAGAKTGRDIIAFQRRQALRSNMELMNATCFNGDKAVGVPGVFSNKNIREVTATTDLATASSGEDLLKELKKIVTEALDATKGLIAPNVLAVSPAIYANLVYSPWAAANGTASVAQVFSQMMGVRVVSVPEFAKGNIAPIDREIALLFNDNPDFIEHIVSNMFEIDELQRHGIGYMSYCVSRHAGICIRQPKSVTKIINKSN
jgi:hypothetical protein